MILLAEYNKTPWNLDAEKTTLEEVFELFHDKKMTKMGKSAKNSLKTAFKHCSKISQMKYKDIKSFHMQDIIDSCGRGYSTQGSIKNLFGHLDRFALELDVIDKSYSLLIRADPIPETKRRPFTNEAIELVWSIKNEPWVDSVLFFLYSGFRLSEMIEIKTSNVNLSAGTIQGGLKTRAGKDRIVPIHSKIFENVKKRAEEGNEYLFSLEGKKLTIYKYYAFWRPIMRDLKLNYTPHECRHTFRSRLDSAGANKVCIDLMMGHKSKEVGERVYTHKTIEELKYAIELVTR